MRSHSNCMQRVVKSWSWTQRREHGSGADRTHRCRPQIPLLPASWLYPSLFKLFILLAGSGLCCMQTFFSCGKQGVLSTRGVGASRHAGFSCWGAQALECWFSSCGARALLLCRMSALPRSGIEPVSPELAGGFLTTGPPGISLLYP